MTTEKQNKLFGIGASLVLHTVAAAVLIFSVSGNAMIPRDLGKLDFVWVSLAAKDKVSFSPVTKDHRPKTSSPAIRTEPASAISATRNIPGESGTIAKEAEGAAYGTAQVFPGSRTVAYAAAGGHQTVSDAGRPTMAPSAAPAFSNAYPLYKENPPPGYPAMARQQGYEGVVLVTAEILTDGRVGQAVVSKSSGYAILDQTAIKAVRAWKFEPAKKSGIPCTTWAELPIKFVISESNSQS